MKHRAFGAAWLFALLVLAAVISMVIAQGEVREVLHALQRVRTAWILAAVLLQAVTYLLAAAVWQLALARQGHHQTLATLVPLSLAMLFSNQALPSVGLSGGLIVESALVRRGTPRPAAMAALLSGLLTTYSAFAFALAAAIVWLSRHGGVSALAMVIAATFTCFAVCVSFGILQARRLPRAWHARLRSWPLIGPSIVAAAEVPPDAMVTPRLFAVLTGLQLVQMGLDAMTLVIVLKAIGIAADPAGVSCSYVMASAGSRVAFAPLGIGTFEGAAVLMLHSRGVAIEPALAATLVFRGLTLWLPMLPGLWSARRALR